MAAARPTLVLPAQLASLYKTGPMLGNGTFGFVYRIVNRETSEDVACKVVRYRSEAEHELVLKEKDIQATLAHPNLVRLMAYYDDEETKQLYLIMPLYKDGSLYDEIVQQSLEGAYYEAEELWYIFAQLVHGLHYLHHPSAEEIAAGVRPVYHRDLKAENILCDDSTVLIADFGGSKFVDNGNLAGSYKGSEPFMAPEIRRGEEYGKEVDIWALGCLFYQLYTYDVPFADDVISSSFRTYRKPDFRPVTPASPRIEEVISSMLSLDATKRPTTSDLLKLDEVREAHYRFYMHSGRMELEAEKQAWETEKASEWDKIKKEWRRIKSLTDTARITQITRNARKRAASPTANGRAPPAKKVKGEDGPTGFKGTVRRALLGAADYLVPAPPVKK